MWFRKLTLRSALAGVGVASPPRRSKSFGPRSIESLEGRELMSQGGVRALGHHLRAPIVHHLFQETDLVSDIPGRAQITDPNLVNPWGITFRPANPNATPPTTASPFWVANNGTGVATLYSVVSPPGTIVTKNPLTVTIPTPSGTGTSAPTGAVFNGTSDFTVPPPGSGPALFMFATEDGTVAAWNASLGTNAVLVVNHSSLGAVYKGLATGNIGTANFLYATDFHNGRIEVFNSTFTDVTNTSTFAGNFIDRKPPSGFAPFGIQNVGGNLFVTYAKQDAAKHDDVAGRGLGIVDEFDTSGNLIRRVATGGSLNAPWGVALAPSTFGRFADDLLIGDFGDGRINAFKQLSNGRFKFVGQLNDTHKPIKIDGLWSLKFGGGGNAGDPNTLFFTAGPANEKHGLLGTLTPVTVITR